MADLTCAICGEPIESLRHTWPEVIGFDPPRAEGGGNKIVLRKTTGRVCHDTCGNLARMGHNPDQGQLGM